MFTTEDVLLALLVGLAVGAVAGMAAVSVWFLQPLQRRLNRERTRSLRYRVAAASGQRRPW